MSTAKPLDHDRRLANYQDQNNGSTTLTPRQRRRAGKKLHKQQGTK
jgi:hypothetical protein